MLWTKMFVLMTFYVGASHQVLEWLDEHVHKVQDWEVKDCESNRVPFSKRQRNICKRNLGYMQFLAKSIPSIKHECRVAFTHEQWNCDVILNSPNFDRSIDAATKESAAVQALAAAKILHTTINDCGLKGMCKKCADREEVIPADRPRSAGEEKLEVIIHQSGACEEMFPQPMNFIKRFLKVGRKKMAEYKQSWPEKYAQENINFHNKQAGLEVAYETRSPRCYCPGIFPVCYTKICYTAMDHFYKVGRKIREMYYKARKVRITDDGNFVPVHEPNRPIEKKELIYAEEFNVCDTKEGLKDRPCSIDEDMFKITRYPYCKDMCCGKNQYKSRPSKLIWECNCKFKWCCEVKCQTCSEDQIRYTCTQ
eukprot:TCONS_00005153-protein